MAGFADILRRAKKMENIKNRGGEWGRCEECEKMSFLLKYDDERNEIWMLCENCAEILIKEEK